MNRRRNIKLLLLAFVVAVIAGLCMGIAMSWIASKVSYTQIAQFTGSLYSRHPELEQVLLQGIHDHSTADVSAGSELLHRYRYTEHLLDDRNRQLIITGSLGIWMVVFLGIAVIMYRLGKQREARVAGLTSYLYSINQGMDRVLPRTGEDEYSFLEDELYKTVVELRQTRELALQGRQILADNLADIAHQIKTPLTSVSLMTELLADNIRNSEDGLYVENIHNQLGRLERLVSSLLTLSRLDAGTLEVQRYPVDVYAMLTSAAEPLVEVMERRKQTLILQSTPAASYLGDFHWSTEAMLNLLKNCSEHTPAGGIVTLSYEQTALYTKIVVEDTGTGFAPEDIPHLFERFYRGKNARKDSVGIGLALAKSLIEKQNGRIRAEERAEGGARFVVKWYEH
ncbi:sensor histidine kinase [Paenibacillus albidus]|nr:HAMP domain-containing sensor histidine kinase [Paenibacillus albidus]